MDPPLSIPNREVKRTYADGTDRPVGRVGSRRSWKSLTSSDARDFFYPRTAATLFTEGRSPQTPCVASLRNLVPPTEERRLPFCSGALPLKYPAAPCSRILRLQNTRTAGHAGACLGRGASRCAPKSRSTNRRTSATLFKRLETFLQKPVWKGWFCKKTAKNSRFFYKNRPLRLLFVNRFLRSSQKGSQSLRSEYLPKPYSS